MKRLGVRCLGGFEVWHGEDLQTGFESQKTKALLAYLLSHRGRALTRDHLATLLWPEKSEETARRNLRQAVYNLKRALPDPGNGMPPILSREGRLQIAPGFDCWYDVEAFDHEITRGSSSRDNPDPHCLATAVGYYRGDFLSGFLIKESETFDLWMMTEQERLRDKALEALRHLVESYLNRGEYRFGIQYARRLVAIDPLAEEAYQYLMQLYALSGRRSQALAQYEDLRQLLESSMEVQPLPETEAIYQSILREQPAANPITGGDEPVGPLVPLVGRQDSYAQLQDCWHSVLDGAGQLTLVTGEAGVGKSRLVKSFLDSASARHDVFVLGGVCPARGPAVYQPFPQLLRNALASDSPESEQALEALPKELITDLLPVVPGVQHLWSDLPPPISFTSATGHERLFEATGQVIEHFCRTVTSRLGNSALVLFLDDLHLAGTETLDLLEFLWTRLASTPTWIVAAYRSEGISAGHPLRRLERGLETRESVSRVALERLESQAVEEIAAALVRDDEAARLARFLVRSGEGLPLTIAEMINFLWDEKLLVPGSAGRWNLAGSLENVAVPASGDFADLIARRFQRLPSSTRRLAAMAAVMGQQFDVELLNQAADELMTVTEVGLEVMLERWLIRQFADSWMTSGRQSIMLWAQGARRGTFEFTHELTRKAVYETLDPRRREIMHGQAAAVFENLHTHATGVTSPGGEAQQAAGDPDTPDSEGLCEILAYHFQAAGIWDRAFLYLDQAAERASRLHAKETAVEFYTQGFDVLGRLIDTCRDPQQEAHWRRERTRILHCREEAEARI